MLRTLLMRLSRRPWKFLFPIALLFFVIYTVSRSRPQLPQAGPYVKTRTKSLFPPLKSAKNSGDYCENFPKAQLENVQIVLKTGAGDLPKTKAFLATVGSCISNLIIVSDHDEKLGDLNVIDVLAELPASYAVNNTDFQAYADHKKAHQEGDNVSYSERGWRLERFKFLPMVDKAYEINPKAKWFVFIESDMFIFWDTLFRMLSQLDPNELHYMGAPVARKGEGRDYSYAGAGFILSAGLMKPMLEGNTSGAKMEKLSHRYEDSAKDDCCGDAVLAHAILTSTGARLESMHPTISGDELKKVRVDKERWCVPLLSIPHMTAEQLESLWKWERTRPYTTKPFVYSSLLAYTHSDLRNSRSKEFWDNLSEAPVPNDRPAHRNAESCGNECEADPNCLQYSFSQTVCRHANYIVLGNAVDRENGGQGEFISGWAREKMAVMGFKTDDQSDMHDTCLEATWLTPHVL